MIPIEVVQSLPDLWAAAVGIVLPVVVAVITRADWSPGVKSGVAFAAVVVSTSVGLLIAGQLGHPTDWRSWLTAALIVFLASTASYRAVWRPSGVTDRIEAATTPANYQPRHATSDDAVSSSGSDPVADQAPSAEEVVIP